MLKKQVYFSFITVILVVLLKYYKFHIMSYSSASCVYSFSRAPVTSKKKKKVQNNLITLQKKTNKKKKF